MQNKSLSNKEYLELVRRQRSFVHEPVLLPHERDAVEAAMDRQAEAFKKVVDEKISVSGGDDWHDGAFRATDNEAKILSSRSAAIAPYMGAIAVDYPGASENMVTLGSRATINQNGSSYSIDIVGFRLAYPDRVIDPQSGEEVTAVSPESPLGSAILGRVVNDEVEYRNGSRRMKAIIERINQIAVKEYFRNHEYKDPKRI